MDSRPLFIGVVRVVSVVLAEGLTVYIAACQLLLFVSRVTGLGVLGSGILWQVLRYPVRILPLRLGHDDDLVAGLAAEGWDVLHGAMLEGVLPRVSDVGRNAVLVPDVFELYFDGQKYDDQEDGGTQGEAQG